MSRQKKLSSRALALFAGLVGVGLSTPALASGLQSGTNAVTTAQTWAYSLVGAASGIYLLYKGVEAYTDRSHWSDFAKAVMWVSITGASAVLATWAWGIWVN